MRDISINTQLKLQWLCKSIPQNVIIYYDLFLVNLLSEDRDLELTI
jgi:hypothetical protein